MFCPLGHISHVAPLSFALGEHNLHAVAPLFEDKPVAHAVQELAPLLLEYVPAAHGAQLDIVPSEYVPAAHRVQVVGVSIAFPGLQIYTGSLPTTAVFGGFIVNVL